MRKIIAKMKNVLITVPFSNFNMADKNRVMITSATINPAEVLSAMA